MAFVLKITDAGIAAAALAASAGPVLITELGLTNTPFDFAPTLEVLPGEFKRLASVAGARTGETLIYLEAFDNSADVWTASGCALYLDDGTLFAALSADEPILAKAGLAFSLIALDVTFAADVAASMTFGDLIFTNPPATTENRGIIEIATQAEATAGTDNQRAITPKTGKGAVTEWLFKRNLHVGQLDAHTPNIGTTGGVRIWANEATDTGILQAISPDGVVSWGYATFTSAGDMNWRGAGGLRAGGSTAWVGNEFTGPINVNGNLLVKGGADFVMESQAPGFPVSLIYNDRGSFGFRANESERILVDEFGVVHIKGARQLNNQEIVPGSGNLRVYAAQPGGYAITTYDQQNYWPMQCVRDINGIAAMVGGIYSTDFSTTFTTSSDYRLKEDLRPVADPLARLRALKPWNFRWAGTDRRTDGFVAHELAEIIPEAVVGERDAMRRILVPIPPRGDGSVDAQGKEIEAFGPPAFRAEFVPDYQSVDQSKPVPLLVAALQELAGLFERQDGQIKRMQARLRKLEGAA